MHSAQSAALSATLRAEGRHAVRRSPDGRTNTGLRVHAVLEVGYWDDELHDDPDDDA